jgi:type III pantothenate kinase
MEPLTVSPAARRPPSAAILCIDVGNTHAHYGVLSGGVTLESGQIPTRDIASRERGASVLVAALRQKHELCGISFCSVVPRVTRRLLPLLENTGFPVRHLRHDACPGLGINYPRPEEIGQDRLANCIGAQVLSGPPAVVIDTGTAVTFDVLTARGYEGGVIAPGLGVMARYLHEQTALLPPLDINDLMVSTGIGKSTLDAMRLGCAAGFAGMAEALLDTVLAQLEKWGERDPVIFTTGGTAGALPKAWVTRVRWEPDITLRGLEEAFLRVEANL